LCQLQRLNRTVKQETAMEIAYLENGPFMVNSYLIYAKAGGQAVIIDPGSDINPLIEEVHAKNLLLQGILSTHGHLDHVAGVNRLKSSFNIPFYMNRNDSGLLQSIPSQSRIFGVENPGIPTVDEFLPDSGMLTVAGFELQLFHTPGHSPGSLSFLVDSLLFSGDALFNFSIGRTDLPGGDYELLIRSIETKLFTLPDSTKVLPGHGPATTIQKEKNFNPFFA
jgi:hydroxyacylglutathione hydrolase